MLQRRAIDLVGQLHRVPGAFDGIVTHVLENGYREVKENPYNPSLSSPVDLNRRGSVEAAVALNLGPGQSGSYGDPIHVFWYLCFPEFYVSFGHKFPIFFIFIFPDADVSMDLYSHSPTVL